MTTKQRSSCWSTASPDAVRTTSHTTWNVMITSFRNSDAIWQHKPGSTLAQLMACCLMVAKHYPHQGWLLIKGVLWHSPFSYFTRSAHRRAEITRLKWLSNLPGSHESITVQYLFQASLGTNSSTTAYPDHKTDLLQSVEFKIGLAVTVSIVALCVLILFIYQSVIFIRNKWRISVQKKGFECE